VYDNHLRLTLSGELRQGSNSPAVLERFSLRVNMTDPGLTGSNSFDQGRLDDMAADAVAFWARPATLICQSAWLTEVKLARVGPLGTYREAPLIKAVNQRGGDPNVVNHRYPLQVALAVSLGTARRGASGRGRFYLPSPSVTMEADTTLEVGAQIAVRDSVAQFLNDLNNVSGIDGNAPQVVVASSKGYNSKVTTVRVGQVLDTIRSRRASLMESYTLPAAVS
jgi:hypothetical protein